MGKKYWKCKDMLYVNHKNINFRNGSIPPILGKTIRIKNQPPNVDSSVEKLWLREHCLCVDCGDRYPFYKCLERHNSNGCRASSVLFVTGCFGLTPFRSQEFWSIEFLLKFPFHYSSVKDWANKLYNDWARWMTVNMNGGEFRDTNWNGGLASRLWAWGADSLGTGRKVGVNQRTRRCDCGAHVHSCVD